MRSVLLFAFILLMGCQHRPKSASDQTDWLIIPQERVGPVTAGTQPAHLRQFFGDEHVHEKDISLGEGFTQPGFIVFPDSPKELEIVYEKDEIAFVRISHSNSVWKTPAGLSIGTDMAKLQKANGRSFRFYGFEWDYSGLVIDWNGGNLPDELIVVMIPSEPKMVRPDQMGEVQLFSDDPALRKLELEIGVIAVTFQE